MAGLDKIIAQIRSQSKEAADQTLGAAKSQAQEILEEARLEAEKECQAILKKGQADGAAIMERGKSAAALDKRRKVLVKKQELIGQVLEAAKGQLKTMPQDQYVELVIRLAVGAARPQEGRILFSEEDKSRLPKDFESQLNEALAKAGRPGAKLKLSPEARDIGAGFVMAYEGIEENCSFDAMFDAAHETLQDAAAQILFGAD